jgi:hypothetical protein
VVNDPSSLGFGFSAQVTLDNTATFTASSAAFNGGMVGSVIRGPQGVGKATILHVASGTSLTANITEPFAIVPNSGGMPMVLGPIHDEPNTTWSITAPIQTITGLNHLAGATVTGLADGAVIPPTVVSAAGSIILPAPASAVTIGLGYEVQIQTLPADVGSSPTIQGQRKKLAAITARVQASAPFKIGSNQQDASLLSPPQLVVEWESMAGAPIPNGAPGPYAAAVPALFSGDIRIPISGGFGKPGQAAMQQSDPLPLQVNAVIPEMWPGDSPEIDEPKEQAAQQRRRPEGAQ